MRVDTRHVHDRSIGGDTSEIVWIIWCQVNVEGLLSLCDLCDCYQLRQELLKVSQGPLSGGVCWRSHRIIMHLRSHTPHICQVMKDM